MIARWREPINLDQLANKNSSNTANDLDCGQTDQELHCWSFCIDFLVF